MDKKAIIGLITSILPPIVTVVCSILRFPQEKELQQESINKAVFKYMANKYEKG